MCTQYRISDIVWTATTLDWSKSFTHIEHRALAVGREGLVHQIPVLIPEYLLPPQWVPVVAPTCSLPLLSEYLFTLHQSVAQNLCAMCRSSFEIFASLQKSPRNHLSYVWTEGQSGIVLVPAQELSVIVSTYPTSNHLLTIILQVHNQTSRHLTRCQCSHLTWFGADLFIPPNKLDIKASIKKLAELHKHPALLATFCTIIGLYILGMIWARHKDRKDITKVWVKYLSCLQLSEPSQQWRRFLRARQARTLRVATSTLPNFSLS